MDECANSTKDVSDFIENSFLADSCPSVTVTTDDSLSVELTEDEELLLTKSPPDTFLIAYIVFLMLGVGALFPWNAYITASDYFSSLYGSFPFEFALSLAYNYPSLISLILTVKYGPYISFTLRIVSSLVVCFVVLAVIPILDSFPIPEVASLSITLFGVLISGVAVAILFGSILGLAALFPPQYTGAVMIGNGVAGIIIGLMRIITKAAFPGKLRTSSIIYFSIAGGIVLLCLVSYFILLRLPITQYYMTIARKHSKRNIKSPETESLTSPSTYKKVRYIPLMRKLWKEAAVVFWVFFVTLSLFPGMTLEIKSNSGLSQGWFAVLLTFTFQLFDFVGRSLPRLMVIFSRRILWIPATSRAIFFALFILCIKPLVFSNIGWAFGFMAVFAVSNGYCGTLAMMYGPTVVDIHERESAGIIMSFFLNFGIFLAVHFSVGLLVIVKGPGAVNV